jgi:O-antigen ligase
MLGSLVMLMGVPNFGSILAALAMLTAVFLLPVEYAIVAVAFGQVMLTAFRMVDGWFGHYFRWGILFLGMFICIARIRGAARNYPGPPTSLFTSLMWLYALAAVATILTSYVPSLTALKALTLVAMIIFLGTTSRWLAEEAGPLAVRRLGRGWVLFSMPALILSTYFWLRGDGASYSDGGFLGTTGNTNSFGALAAFLLPLLAARLFGHKLSFSGSFLPSAGFVLLIVYLLYISRSRASLLAFVVSMVVCYFIEPRSQIFRVAAGGGVAVLLFLTARPESSINAIEQFAYKGSAQHGILGSRLGLWVASTRDFMENPLMGIGYGITDSKEERWQVDTATRGVKEERGSSPLAVLSQVGLLGGVPYLAAVLLVAIRSVLFARQVHDPWLTAMTASVWAGITNSLFEGWMTSVGSGLLWLLLTQCYLLDAVMSRLRPPRRAAVPLPWVTRHPLRSSVPAPAGD